MPAQADANVPIVGRDVLAFGRPAQNRQRFGIAAPRVEVHPNLADRLGVSDGQTLLVESRRGAVHFVVRVSPDIRPDTLFAPFHWGGRQAANVLTIPALDPTSRMPEFKVCAVRASAAAPEALHES